MKVRQVTGQAIDLFLYNECDMTFVDMAYERLSSQHFELNRDVLEAY